MTRSGLLCFRTETRGSAAAAADMTERLIAEAAANGAKIICTQELFLTEYFCWKQDPAFFDLAHRIPSALTDRFCGIAKRHEVVLILSLFEHRAPGLHHNTRRRDRLRTEGFSADTGRCIFRRTPDSRKKFYFTARRYRISGV